MNHTIWKRRFFTVALGQAVSMLGSHGVQFALIWWLAEQTASPMMLGLSGIVAYLPAAVFSPLAGVAADRFDRKKISIIADMSMGLIALLYALLLSRFDLPVWTVLIMLGVRGLGETFQQPAVQSIVPQLVPEDQLVQMGGWLQLFSAGSFLLGPPIGAALYAAFPLSVVLMTDVIGAVIASIALAVVKIPPLEKHAEREGVFRSFRSGVREFRKDRRLLYLVIGEALCMFFYAPLSSFYPLMTSSYFNLSALYGSMVELAFAVGMIVSSLLFSKVLHVTDKIKTGYIGLLGMGVTALLCGLIPANYIGWFFFAVTCSLLGASGNVHTIPLNAYIQETMAPETMGRAFSVLTMISSVTMPVGLLIASPIAEHVGVSRWFLLSGICMLVLTVPVLLIGEREKEQPIHADPAE